MAKHSKKTNINKKYFLVTILILFFVTTVIGININNKSSNQILELKENSYLNKLEQELLNQNDENLISNKYLVTDNTIERIKENTKVEEFLKDFNNEIKLYKDEKMEEEVSSGIVLGTMYAEDKEENIYSLIIDGDVNKDGFVNQIDISKIIRNELPDEVAKKASEVGIEKISDKIVYGKFDLGDIKDVISPEIEILNGEKGENDYFISDVEIKINQKDNDASKTVYKIKGTEEREVKEVEENEIINLKNDGVYKIIAYSYGKDGNKSKIAQEIIKINKTEVEASLTYTPEESTTGSVIAKVSFNKEGITITNNDGKDTFEFTENGSFTFEFEDEAGRKGSIVATVDWIKREEIVGQDGEWKYFIRDDGTIQLTQYLGNNTEIVVPANYDGNVVYSVGNQYATTETEKRFNIFGDLENTTATKLTIENGIKEIGLAAFSGCSSLTGNLVIPESVKKIDSLAFESCSGFTGDIVIPNSVEELGIRVFQHCSGFNGKIVFSEKITEIPDYTFNYCSGLKNPLVIPENITKIGSAAFQNCNKISGTLNIPTSVTEIAQYAFNKCSSLTGDLIIPSNVKVIGKAAFQNCTGFNGRLELPEGLEEIADNTFVKCSGLSGNLVIPDSVKKIGKYAFYNCSGFTGDLNIPNEVRSIDYGAFYHCIGFNGNLNLSDNLEIIGDNVFMDCTGLTGDLIIPNSVKSLGNVVFQNCTGLNGTLTLSENISEIGNFDFFGCTGLTGNIIIPEGVTKIGNYAFNGCTGFNGILQLPSTLTEVGEFAFNGCKNLTGDLIIPDSVTKIGDVAFQSLSKMTGELKISKNVKTIGKFAFYDDKFTGELIIPEGLEELGQAAFGKNTNFSNKTVIIPSTLRKIGIDAEFNGENVGLSTHDFYNFGANAKNFEEFVVAEGNEYFKAIDGVLYTIDEKRMISYPRNKKDETFEIPESVITLDELSIASNCILDTIIIPDNFVLDPIPNFIRMEGAHVLTSALYSYNEVDNIVAKETNPNYTSVDGVLYNKDITELVYISSGRTSQVIIPEGVTSIRDRALYWNQVYYVKASKIYIPASLENITDAQINSLNSISQKIEVSPDNTKFTVDANNKLIRK